MGFTDLNSNYFKKLLENVSKEQKSIFLLFSIFPLDSLTSSSFSPLTL